MEKPNNHNAGIIKKSIKKRIELSVEEYINGIKSGDRTTLGRAITLVESNKKEHKVIAEKIIEGCLPSSGKSIRIGITGVPGVGKSTFIESFGFFLAESGKKTAVLAIDPSSDKTGGSILGDKTRMEKLSTHPQAFIRPSPSRGSLGGVTRNSRETIILCEAAGYEVILVETVGVGQSEVAVHSMVDFFLLLMLAGAGDELQGIKRGIMEMADAIAITKSDGDNRENAKRASREYKNALHLFPASTSGWTPTVECISALKDEGMDQLWKIISEHEQIMKSNGLFDSKRKEQAHFRIHETIKEQLLNQFYEHPEVQNNLKDLEQGVADGNEPVLFVWNRINHCFS